MGKSLPVPPAARADSNGLEMIRVWIAKGGLHTSLQIGFWEDRGLNEPDSWGVLLADMVRHIGNAHEERYGRDRRETITAIRQAFEREMARPTSATKGSFVDKSKGKDRD